MHSRTTAQRRGGREEGGKEGEKEGRNRSEGEKGRKEGKVRDLGLGPRSWEKRLLPAGTESGHEHNNASSAHRLKSRFLRCDGRGRPRRGAGWAAGVATVLRGGRGRGGGGSGAGGMVTPERWGGMW